MTFFVRFAVLVVLVSTATATFAQDAVPVAKTQTETSELATKATSSLLLDVASTGTQLVAVGAFGNLVVSNDGEHWTQIITPARSTLTAVFFTDAQNGWAVGHDAVILHTADGAKSWSVQHFKPELNQPLLDVFFLDVTHGYAIGSFGLFLETRDGGKSWLEVDAPVIKEEGSHLNAMIRLRDGRLLIVGERGFIAMSGDGGAWEKLESPYEGSFFGASPMGEKGALIFGLRGNAFLSDDARAWRQVNLGSTRTAFGGAVMPDGRAVLVGADGLALSVSADGSVSEKGLASIAGAASGGTLSGVVPWKTGVMAVGDLGVQPRGATP
ncbi:MAG: YCF48-related protein [Panacagrimonas sp.]